MPILPLEHSEAPIAVVGTMLYPGTSTADRAKARACAAWMATRVARGLHDAGEEVNGEDLLWTFSDGGLVLEDLNTRWRDGTAIGQIFKAFFALYCTDPTLASWKSATKLATITASQHGESGSRALLYNIRRDFRSVAHLWAAWVIRGGRFQSNPEVGYQLDHDFQFFLNEAEGLRHWGQTWRPARSKAEPPLPEEVWRVPDGWSPPTRQPGWPMGVGRVREMTIHEDLLARAGLRGPGRPKKSA